MLSGSLSESESDLDRAWLGGDLMTHNCRKLEKYLFPGISGCIFDPAMGGPGESSYQEGSEYVWQRGVGSQKCLFMGNFQSVPCYRKRTDQKPPINRHFWIPTPLWHTYSEPSWHEDSPGPPLPPQKMHPELPRNKYFSSFGQLWVIKSPP